MVNDDGEKDQNTISTSLNLVVLEVDIASEGVDVLVDDVHLLVRVWG